MIGIETKRLELKSLKETSGNPQKMSDEEFSGMVQSMREKGWLLDNPVVRELKKGVYQILSGHHRIKAAIQAGIIDVDCKVLKGIDDATAKKLVLEANSRRGTLDDDKLNYFIQDILENHDLDFDSLYEEVGLIEDSKTGIQDIAKEISKKEKDYSNKDFNLFQIIITCKNEQEQEMFYKKLKKEGYECQVLIL